MHTASESARWSIASGRLVDALKRSLPALMRNEWDFGSCRLRRFQPDEICPPILASTPLLTCLLPTPLPSPPSTDRKSVALKPKQEEPQLCVFYRTGGVRSSSGASASSSSGGSKGKTTTSGGVSAADPVSQSEMCAGDVFACTAGSVLVWLSTSPFPTLAFQLEPFLCAYGGAACTPPPRMTGRGSVLTEGGSVGGQGMNVCSGCHAVRYCGKEHQRAHWKTHKPLCAELKRAGELQEKTTADTSNT